MLLFLIPVISAFIGWITNWIAIKMLFHPKQPRRFLGITIQGIFPKRQKHIAQKLGSIVANDLLQVHEITANITQEENLKSLTPFIETHIDGFLKTKLKEKLPIVSMFVGDNMLQKIKEGLMEEIEVLLPQLITQYADQLEEKLDIQSMVAEKITNFSSDKLETMLVSILQKEFRFIELIGAVLGFMIGLIQVLLTMFAA
jgi:uncharacterized membrane protein YheB (UPF0754 family)